MLYSSFAFLKSALGYSPDAKFAAFWNEVIVWQKLQNKKEPEIKDKRISLREKKRTKKMRKKERVTEKKQWYKREKGLQQS